MTDAAVKETPFDALAALAEKDAAGPPPRQTSIPGTRARGERKGTGGAPVSRGPLERRLFQFFTMVSMVVSAVLDPTCGAVIQTRATILAKAWAELAAQDANVKKALEWLLTSGNYGQVIMVTGMTVLPILRHHNLIPGSLSEVVRIGIEEAPEDEDEDEPTDTTPNVVPGVHPMGDVPR